MTNTCNISFIPWLTDCDLWSGLTIEFSGMIIEILIIFVGLEALRRHREYKRYINLRVSTRQLFSKYSRNIVDEVKNGIELLLELKEKDSENHSNQIDNNPFQKVQDLHANFSRDLCDRYHLLDIDTIRIGEISLRYIEELMSVWCISRMIDTDSGLSWKAKTHESFIKSISDDMVKIEDLTSEISLIKTILSSIKFRGLNFSEASKLIASKIKQVEKKHQRYRKLLSNR
jgi:hypothetical protein